MTTTKRALTAATAVAVAGLCLQAAAAQASPMGHARGGGSQPVITSLSHDSGPIAGGQKLVITGHDFADPLRVSFGGVKASKVKVDSTRKITVVTPKHTPAGVQVEVATHAGVSSASKASTYLFQRYGFVAAGSGDICTIHAGRISCAGDNSYGQLGVGNLNPAMSFQTIHGLPSMVAVSIGDYYACGLSASGSVFCWGSDDEGQLGNGENGVAGDTDKPVRVKGISGVVELTTGLEHTCAMVANQTIECWGINDDGELGLGKATAGDKLHPTKMPKVKGALEVSNGDDYTCVLLASHTVQCVGLNNDGSLGDGSPSSSVKFHKVVDLNHVTQISASYQGACAITRGIAKCWGDNSDGQLGDGGNEPRSTTPRAVAGLNGVGTIEDGNDNVCATENGSEFCWGDETYGTDGNGEMTSTYLRTPGAVSAITGVGQIAVGSGDACAVVSGKDYCWGLNSSYEFGDGTTTDRDVPATVS